MDRKHKVSNQQIKGLVVSMMVGIGILSLPSVIANIMANDGWIGILLGGILNIPFIIIINKIFQLYPDKDFFEIGRDVLSPVIFNIFLVGFLMYVILLASYVTRNLVEVMRIFLLDTTPSEIIAITFILATSYIARSEIDIIGRAGYHIYPIIIGFAIFIIIVSIPNADFTNLLPVFQSNIRLVPKGIRVSFFSYIGFEILLLTIPYAEKKEKTLKYSLMALAIVTLIYILIFVMALSQYGIHQLQRQNWPTLALIKEIDLPGYFIENLDGVVMAFWVLVIFGTMGPAYYSAGKILSELFNTKTHELFIIPLLPIIYIVSLIPQNLVQINDQMVSIVNYFAFFSIMIMSTLIYIVGYIKKRRENE